MRQLLATCAFVLAACGGDSIGSEDASPDASDPDAAIDATATSPIQFFPPQLQPGLNSASDDRFAVLASGGTSVFFARSEVMNGFIVNVPYVARRPALDLVWNTPVRAAAFGTVSIWDFEMADDELEWFHWKGLGQLSSSSRASTDDGWSAPADLGFDGFSPSISVDNQRLYYVTFENLIMRRDRADRGAPWQSAQIQAVPGDLDIASIDLSSDELLVLITVSTSSPEPGVFAATRDSIDEPFSLPIAIPNLAGRYENARFGAFDQRVTLIDRSGPDREIAIAARVH